MASNAFDYWKRRSENGPRHVPSHGLDHNPAKREWQIRTGKTLFPHVSHVFFTLKIVSYVTLQHQQRMFCAWFCRRVDPNESFLAWENHAFVTSDIVSWHDVLTSCKHGFGFSFTRGWSWRKLIWHLCTFCAGFDQVSSYEESKTLQWMSIDSHM